MKKESSSRSEEVKLGVNLYFKPDKPEPLIPSSPRHLSHLFEGSLLKCFSPRSGGKRPRTGFRMERLEKPAISPRNRLSMDRKAAFLFAEKVLKIKRF